MFVSARPGSAAVRGIRSHIAERINAITGPTALPTPQRGSHGDRFIQCSVQGTISLCTKDSSCIKRTMAAPPNPDELPPVTSELSAEPGLRERNKARLKLELARIALDLHRQR